MAAARPPQRPQDDGAPEERHSEERVREDDGGEVASFEVGAGVPTPEGEADRRPFLRAVLSDGTRTILNSEGDREVVVHDRFARLDAGLPPLPDPTDDSEDEDLSPVVHRPDAGRAASLSAVTSPSPAAGSSGRQSAAERFDGERSDDAARRSNWQHLAPPRPAVVPKPEPPAPRKPVPAPPAVAATKIRPEPAPPARDPRPSGVVPFAEEEDDDGNDPRSVAFEAGAIELTEPVTDRFAPSNAAPEEDEVRVPAATRFEDGESDEEDDEPPPPKPSTPWRRSIFRAFSG